jgi:alkylation response protein AidB-like acyl-CoA dehydrogenase
VDLLWSEQDEQFRDEVRDWLRDNRPTEARPAGTAGAAYDRAWQRTLFDGGWAGLNWPAEHGGRGLSLIEQMIWYEEYAKADGPPPGVLFVSQAHAGPTLIALGTEAQKAKHLNGILRGEEIWCQGFSEPSSGSDLASLRTKGVIDGDEIVVSGQKIWTSSADVADYQELLIRTEPDSQRHKGLSWVICDMHTRGITVHPIRNMTGEAEFCSVFYDEVRIPIANVVGEVGQGWRTAMATLGFERGTAFVSEMTALVLRLERLIDWARANPVPGGARPAWSDDAVRRRFAMLRAEMAGLRALNYANLARYAGGATPGGEGSIVKLFTNEIARAIDGLAVELMGERLLHGDGEASHYWAHYMSATVRTIGGGTPEIQREIIADRVLDLPRSR